MATPVGQLTIEMAANIVRLQKDMDAARKTVDGAMQSITKTVDTAMRSIGTLFAGVSLTAFAGKLVSVEREFGTLNASLVTVTGSAREADKAFALLTDFASKTPFSLQEVTAAFIKMKALGLDASEVALRSYGNTASAMGKSLNQMIEAVADAATGEFERLKEFGIRAKSEGDRVTLTFRGVSTNIGKNAAEIEGYLRRIGDVDFAGAMDARAKTLDGAISNLGDSWDSLFRTINNELTGPLLMTAVQGAQTAVVGMGAVVRNLTEFMEDNKIALMAFAAALAGPAIVSGIGAATAAFVAMRTAVLGLTLAFASNPIALAILAITAAAVPAIDGIQRYMNANKDLEREQAKLNQSQAETERLLRQAEPVKAKAVVSTNALTDSQKTAVKEQEKQKVAYEKLLKDIEDKTGAMLLEQQQTEKLTSSQQYALKIMQDIQSGTLKLTDAQKIRITQSLEEMLATEKVNAEMKDLASTQQAAIALSNKLNDEQSKNTEELRSNVVSLMQQNDELRYGKDAVLARQIAVMRSTATDLEFQAATEGGNSALEEQARLLRQQADLAEDNALLTAAKNTKDEWEKTSDAIEKSLTDALMRGFESGKDFGKSLKDSLVNMFKTLILRPIIQPVAQGASNYVLTLLGLGSSTAAGATTPIMLGGASIAAQGSAFGQGFASTVSGWFTGGAEVTSMGSATSGAFGAGASTASAIPYVAAALVAANAMGLMRSTKVVGGGLTGTLGEGDITSYDLQRRGGTLFNGPSYSMVNTQVSELSNYLQTSFKDMRNASAQMARAIGKSSAEVEAFTMVLGDVRVHPDIDKLGLVLDGLSDEQKTAKIQEAFAAAQEGMAKLILGATDLQRAGETAFDALKRLTDIQTISESLNQFGGAFSNFATASISARQSIIDLAGGLDSLVQKAQGFVANFYTREEQAAITAKGVVSALSQSGFTQAQIAALETRQDFRTLLESIDVNTSQGQQQFVALLNLQQQYANLAPVLEEQSKSLLELVEAAPQVEILQRIFESDADYAARTADSAAMAQETFNSMDNSLAQIVESTDQLTIAMRDGLMTLSEAVNSTIETSNAQIIALRAEIAAQAAADANTLANQIAAVVASATATQEALLTAITSGSSLSAGTETVESSLSASGAGSSLNTFASGGYMNGMGLVGEHGPELFDPTRRQIYTAPATSNIFGGNEVAAEIRALRDEVSMMRSETRSTAVNTAKIARLQDNWDVRGLTVRTDADQPLDTVTV